MWTGASTKRSHLLSIATDQSCVVDGLAILNPSIGIKRLIEQLIACD